MDSQTIVAQASPPGRGGVSVIRISGPESLSIALTLCKIPDDPAPSELKPRYAALKSFYGMDGCVLDQGLVIYFPAPHSFTGEHVIELQGHGGPVLVEQLVKRCCELGARRANPGEFSLRAFLNNKIDLAQAEAIADLIDAHSVQAARCAMASLQGAFSNEVQQLANEMLDVRIYVEAAMDFPEEDIDFLDDQMLLNQVTSLLGHLRQLLVSCTQGVKLNEGLNIAILGPPNVGKSSILNLLSGQDTAIVTPIAGTTRDVLKSDIVIAGYQINIADTAGLRETDDVVEQEGIRRAKLAAEQAEHHLFVMDAEKVLAAPEFQNHLTRVAGFRSQGMTVIVNKIDVLTELDKQQLVKICPSDVVFFSARTGEGLDQLTKVIESIAGGRSEESQFTARQRHVSALTQAYELCNLGFSRFKSTGSGELFAEDLKQAHQCLGEITGRVSSDDLLGHIFSSFCIGK